MKDTLEQHSEDALLANFNWEDSDGNFHFLPIPAVTYADHSYPAFSKHQMMAAYKLGLAARDEWISVKETLPKCSMKPNSFGVQVQIYPPLKQEGYSDVHVAFYGCRATDEPNFYIYGRVIDDVQFWACLLPPPIAR